MTSKMFSKLLPGGAGRSFYDDLRARSDGEDVEDRAGLLDEANLNHQFHDFDLDNVEGLAVDDSRQSLVGGPQKHARRGPSRPRTRADPGRNKWFDHAEEGENNDVPESLLVEPHDMVDATHAGQRRNQDTRGRQGAIPGLSTSKARSQWETTQAQQRLHHEENPNRRHPHGSRPGAIMATALGGDARKKAEWRWANVSNLDYFMHDVYAYYQGRGFWCILLERALHLV
jgi:autophagy-related protein 9